MSHVQPSEIASALATGKPVWSLAICRMGRITRIDGNTVELRPGRKGKGRPCVTWFHRGDCVRLVEHEDRFTVVNTFEELQ